LSHNLQFGALTSR
jgi:hypothetical protein